MTNAAALPQAAAEAVFTASEEMDPSVPVIRGTDFNVACDLDSIMDAMLTTGFQATCLGQAVREVDRMLSWRLSDEPLTEEEKEEVEQQEAGERGADGVPGSSGRREDVRTKIFVAPESS